MKTELSPAAQRVIKQMEPGKWYSAARLGTTRPIMDQLWRKKLAKRKLTKSGECSHRPEMGALYQLTGEADEL